MAESPAKDSSEIESIVTTTAVDKKRLFIHPKLMELIGRDDHGFEPYG